jgi:hypothetical protein
MARKRSTDGLFVALGSLITLLTPLGEADAKARIVMPPRRFAFKIDPKTPVKDLLPSAPEVKAPTPPWLVKDLAQTPEILFAKHEFVKRTLKTGAKTPEETQKALKDIGEDPDKAMEKTARLIAQINLINQQDPEYLLGTLLRTRPDLDGLPFIMGDTCRQSKTRSLAFLKGVNLVVNSSLEEKGNLPHHDDATAAKEFWSRYDTQMTPPHEPPTQQEGDAVENNRERMAALMQMLAPKPATFRQQLVRRMADLEHADMSPSLARLAIFSFDSRLRDAATAGLKKRPAKEYTDILLTGLRHPWPAVVEEASKVIVQLERKDLVPQLVAILDELDPRAPFERDVAGEKQTVVRELVRINHHRNCLLCHPPGNTPDVRISKFGRPMEIAAGAVPSPGQPFPSTPSGYDPNASPDILVRADITYLRQDFSRLEKVADAAPWPEMQRFDYLVRTRKVSAAEAAAYQDWLTQQGPAYVPPHHQAVHAALRALTGRDVTEPTAKAWRAALGS